jgi:hypothetical protein
MSKLFGYDIFDTNTYRKYKGVIEDLLDISDKCKVVIHEHKKYDVHKYYYDEKLMFDRYKIDDRFVIGKTSLIVTEIVENNTEYNYFITDFVIDFITNFIDHDSKIKEHVREL